MAFTRKEYRRQMADMFIDNLKKISADSWTRPWKASNIASPYNGSSGRYYSGSNQFFLMMVSYAKDYKDPRWYTFNQIKEKGYRLQKDSKGVPVEYWFPVIYDEQGNKKRQLTWIEYNRLPKTEMDLCQIRFRTSYVYNGSRIDGLPAPDINDNQDIELSDLVGTISQNMGVTISEDGGNSAFYSPSTDSIHLPERSTFADGTFFNSTALHELSHATGHHSRLNRLTGAGFGSENYAFEELIAEISSTFMAPYIGVEINDEVHNRNHFAYVKSWIDAIQNDPEILFKAIAKAEVAASYLEMKAGIISELEFTKSLKNAHIAIGNEERIRLVENLHPDETIAFDRNSEKNAKYVEKIIGNLEESAEYFDELQLQSACALAATGSDQLSFKVYRIELFDRPATGISVYHNNELLFTNSLDVQGRFVDQASMIKECARILSNSSVSISYSFEDSEGEIRKAQLSSIEENYAKGEADSGTLPRDETLYKDEEKILENHVDELEDIQKFIDDHEKLLAQRNIDLGKTPVVINIFSETSQEAAIAAAKITEQLIGKGYDVRLMESFTDDLSNTSDYERLKYQIERTDRFYDADFLVNEGPLLLNDIEKQNNSRYSEDLVKLVNQYANFNAFIGNEGSLKETAVRNYLKGHNMYPSVYSQDSIPKLIDNAVKNRTRINDPERQKKSYDEYKKRSEEELFLLKDSISIKDYARDVLGFNLVKQGQYYSLAEHDSVVIYPDNSYYRYATYTGTTIIDFIKEFDEKAQNSDGKAIVIAKKYYNEHHPDQLHVFSQARAESKSELAFADKETYKEYLRHHAECSLKNPELPSRAASNSNVDLYLNEVRGISMATIREWEKRDLLYEDEKRNAVFVGRDFDGNAKYYHLKGTGEERYMHDAPSEISDKTTAVSFDNAKARHLYVTEAAVDAMSLQDILGGADRLKDSSFLSLQSVSNTRALARYLATRDTSNLEDIMICTDADEAGERCVKNLMAVIDDLKLNKKLPESVSARRVAPKPGFKDFNDELKASVLKTKQASLQKSPTLQIDRGVGLNMT